MLKYDEIRFDISYLIRTLEQKNVSNPVQNLIALALTYVDAPKHKLKGYL